MILHANECLKSRHKASTCAECYEICPVGSIVLLPTSVSLDIVKCVQCGACAGVCPMDAFELDTQKLNLISQNGENNSDEVVFTCEKVGASEQNAVKIPCIASLDKAMLLHFLVLGKDIKIFHANCDKCTLGGVKTLIYERINHIKFLRDLGDLKSSVEISAQGDIDIKKERKDELKTQALVRRRFFKKLFSGESGKPDEALRVKNFSPANHSFKKQNDYVKSLAALFSKSEIPTANIGKKPQINENCKECSICARVCPSGAIRLEENSNFTLSHDASICLQCRLCEDICFAKAINFTDKTLKELIEPKRLTLYVKPPTLAANLQNNVLIFMT